MKFLLIVSDSIIDDITERYQNIEIKPIKQPMFVDTSGYSIYLTQDYVDALMKLSEKIVIEDAVKKATDNLLTVPKFELGEEEAEEYEEWHSMNGVIKMPKGLFEKIYNEAKEDNDDI